MLAELYIVLSDDHSCELLKDLIQDIPLIPDKGEEVLIKGKKYIVQKINNEFFVDQYKRPFKQITTIYVSLVEQS